jgi:TonB-dependent receptor
VITGKKNIYFLNILFIILALVFLPTSDLLSQKKSSTISGKVTDKSNNEALIGAYLSIEGTSFITATGIDGKYLLQNIPLGKYLLKVSYIGYNSVEIAIDISSREKVEKNISMEYSGVQLGAVEVTAQAKGQIKAINNQLNSNSIQNIVSSDKLQELPDANAAEAIGRLPGVSVLRVGGEGNQVIIRGLAPKYNKVMIEGVSMASSNSDRSTDISMISPFAIDGIELTKANTADKDGDFIGGTVNFKLKSAPKGFHYDIISQLGYNDLKNTINDYLFVGSVSNRFFNDKLGLYLQGNIEKRNRSAHEQAATFILKNPEIDIQNTIYTETLQLSDVFRTKDRQGLTLLADFQFKNGRLNFKNFFSKSKTDVNRFIEHYDVPNRSHKYETRDELYDIFTISNILDYEQRLGQFKINVLLANNRVNNENPKFNSFVFEQKNAINSDALNLIIPPTELVNYNKIDNSNAYFQTLNESSSISLETQNEASLDVLYDFTINKKFNGNLKIGGKLKSKKRDFDKTVFAGNFVLNSGQPVKDAILRAFPEMQQVTPLGSTTLPFVLFENNSFDHHNYMNGKYTLGSVADLDLMRKVLEVIKSVPDPPLETYTRHDWYSVREDYKGSEFLNAAYAMGELNIGTKIKFIPGVRYESNSTHYTAPRGDASLAFPNLKYKYSDTTINRTSDFLLPMVHLKYSPFKWFDVRVAYTHTIFRPNYTYITPRIDLMPAAVIWNNIDLKTEKSINYDIYLSFHTNKLGLFTIGGFSKQIQDMIFPLDRRVILNASLYDLSTDVVGRDIYTQANNKYDAKVYGLELDLQTTFWYLPGSLKGLVLNLNYTFINSQAKYPRTVVDKKFDPITFKYIYNNIDTFYVDKLQQQPEQIINVQLGYDYKGFSGRISMLYQSSIFQRPNFWPELSSISDSYMRWDLSLKQELPWFGLQIFSNINNISGALERDFVKGVSWDSKIQSYSFSIDLGLRLKL